MTATPAETINLAGPWSLRPDPGDEGVKQNWWRFADWREKHITMQVPGAWQKVLGPKFHGIAWLARTARIPRPWAEDTSRRIRLRFDAVATDTIVQVNGIEVRRHSGDYLPFEFDITDAARLGWQGKTPLNPASPDEINICLRVDEVVGKRPSPGQTVETGHITKGFHDILSCQHGGVWDGVTLRRTGDAIIQPDGIRVHAEPSTGRVTILVNVETRAARPRLSAIVRDAQGRTVGEAAPEANNASTTPAALSLTIPSPRHWSPDSPSLYIATVTLADSERASDESTVRFGFRSVSTGGPNNSQILLNGKPLLLRGVLHWGHEPDHIAPAPTPDQVRAEFKQLRAMGFNCVCLCMWYPPQYYFDIADETGMLIWQEHPVWKSPMEEELIPEYQQLFEGFFRRDRNHPSVIIVSGSCEHERIHPDLAAWWWKRAKEENPDRLVQVQTAFTGWVNPNQTDLHDEHVYESSGRWVKFCEDLQPALAELPPKPFVMGETVIGTSWLDTAAFAGRSPESSVLSPESLPSERTPSDPRGTTAPDSGLEDSGLRTSSPPWWFPKGLAECAAFERQIESRYGPATLARFRATAERQNLATRKFQSEVFRSYPNHAGWVMNQIRDVPPARLGFMDDLGRWRFSPDQTRPWLAESIALLHTPDHRRGFTGGRSVACKLGVSNFGAEPLEGPIQLRIGSQHRERDLSIQLRAAPGEVSFAPLALDLPAVESPTIVNLRAVAPGLPPNWWDLHIFPDAGDIPEHIVRLDGLPFSRKDLEPEFEERCYSSGWGLKVRSWKSILPYPETVLFKAPLWRFDAPLPPNTRVIVTHKLTPQVLDFLTFGGRVILLASKTPGGLGTKFVCLWGQCPLVIEEGPLLPGDAPWIEDLLHHDLTRRYTRAIPTQDLKIADQVDPLIRLVFTHDGGIPRLMDSAFMARVGRGLLIATSLDHTEDPGRFLMQRFLEFAASDAPICSASLDPALVKSWSI